FGAGVPKRLSHFAFSSTTVIRFSAASCVTTLASAASRLPGCHGAASVFLFVPGIIALQLGCSVCDDQHGVSGRECRMNCLRQVQIKNWTVLAVYASAPRQA